MSTVYLNGEFLPQQQASLPIMDRAILFGDSIYEVIPVCEQGMIGFELHIERLHRNLGLTGIAATKSVEEWKDICVQLMQENGSEKHLYIQVSRGAEPARDLKPAGNSQPSVIAFSLSPANPNHAAALAQRGYHVCTAADIRWRRCDVKSTSLMGGVMTIRHAIDRDCDEVLMYNSKQELTEGGAVNVFVASNGVLATPPLDHQQLPGITRHILLQIIRNYSDIECQQRVVTMAEVHGADEILLTSSTRGVVAAVLVDGEAIGDGKPGPIATRLAELYKSHCMEF